MTELFILSGLQSRILQIFHIMYSIKNLRILVPRGMMKFKFLMMKVIQVYVQELALLAVMSTLLGNSTIAMMPFTALYLPNLLMAVVHLDHLVL